MGWTTQARLEEIVSRAIVVSILTSSVIAKAAGMSSSGQMALPTMSPSEGARSEFVLLAMFVEIIVIVLTLRKKTWIVGLRATVALCGLFAIYTLISELQGHDLSACGCFGDVELGFGAHMSLLVGMAISAIMGLRSAELSEGAS